MLTLLAIVLVFGLLIAIHELGHFLAGKRAGVQVDEYSIGFGPPIWQQRSGETTYSLRMLPLGGFCRLAGMAGDIAGSRPVPPGRGFTDKPVWQRMGIIAAGPLMNFVLAVVLFALTFGVVGVPSEPTLVVQRVEQGFPAAAAGLQPGDRLVALDGRPLRDWQDLQRQVQARAGQIVRLTFERAGRQHDVQLVPRRMPDGQGVIGVQPRMALTRYGLVQAVGQGLSWTWSVVAGWFVGIAQLLTGAQGTADVMGPVGISVQIGQAAQMGLPYLLMLAAVLSANLGLVNLLPIPALDGSHLVFLAVEGVRGRPVDPAKESFVHFIGFALLILLSLVITYRDILRLNVG